MHILPLLSLLPLALAIQGTEFDICVASRSSGLSDISGVQRRFGTDWTKDNWTVQVAPTTHSQAVKPKDSDIVIRTTKYISEEGPVNLTYSCLQNVPTGSYAKLTKVMQIPTEQVSAVDDGVVAVDYYVHNPFFMADGAIVEDDGFLDNLAETASVPLGYEFVNLTFVDAKGGVVAWFLDDNGGGNYSTAKGVSSRYIYVPEGTRSIKAEIYGSVGSPQDTLPSSFCIGRYSVFTYQFDIKFRDRVQKIVNVTFIICLAFIVLVPLAMLVETRRYGKNALKMIDLVHTQGSRLIRGMFFSLCVSFLYATYQWLTAKKGSPYTVMPVFSGIDSQKLASSHAVKAVKTPVFMLCFLIIGLMFWPIAMCYGHVNEGSRLAAVLGFLAVFNIAILRGSLQYLQMNPLDSVAIVVFYHLIELFAFIAITVYFAVSIAQPGRFESYIRKTYFHNAIHVTSLLRKITNSEPPKTPPKKPSTLLSTLKSKFTKLDVRPIWIRGRELKSETTTSFLKTSLTHAPVRLISLFFMITLFTYTDMVLFVSKIFSGSPRIACVLGTSSTLITRAFDTVFQVLEEIGQTQLFGESVRESLGDLVGIGNMVDLFQRMVRGSCVCACLMTGGILVFNVVDLAMTVRRDVGRLRKGDYGFLLEGEMGVVSSAFASQFMGIQIGFAFIGTLWTLFCCMLICFLLACFFSVEKLRRFLWDWLMQNGFILIAVVVSYILGKIQQYVVNRFFVAHYEVKVPEKNKVALVSTKFWLKNINKYNQMDYLFLFPNLINGLTTFLGQIMTTFVASFIFSYRLDKRGLMPMFSKYSLYLSWILQEHHHNNPIVHVAVKLLRDSVLPENLSSIHAFTNPKQGGTKITRQNTVTSFRYLISDEENKGTSTSLNSASKRARTRWFLAYTLIKNPNLSGYRKQRVQETLLAEWVSMNEAKRIRKEVLEMFEAREEEEAGTIVNEMRERENELWKYERLVKSEETTFKTAA